MWPPRSEGVEEAKENCLYSEVSNIPKCAGVGVQKSDEDCAAPKLVSVFGEYMTFVQASRFKT